MFSEPIPERVSAVRFVDAGERLAGALDPAHYKRLAEIATSCPEGLLSYKAVGIHLDPRSCAVPCSVRCA